MYLLHGNLELKIVEARFDLDMEFFCEHGHHYLQYPYVKAYMGPTRVARTNRASAESSCNPVWNHHFKLPLAYSVHQAVFKVKDNGMFGAKLIGIVTVPAKRISAGEVIDEWFPVIGLNGEPLKADIVIRLQMTFTPCHKNPTYLSGITNNYGLKESYFPSRHGGKLTLYQDAHLIDGMVPEIKLEGGRDFENNKCWEDICHAIVEAHHFVYIVGWSISHKVKLVRKPTATRPLPNGGDFNLGELLKYKSEEGVRVVVLVWEDKTSHSKFFIKTGGIMKTHDKETREFFKHSPVTCVLAPCYRNFKRRVPEIWFSHHQKCVIADVGCRNANRRKIAAFLGGLDLCDGRYDTPNHQLYIDHDTVFKDDFSNPSLGRGKKGPRQPWHDLHCRIEGPAAYDVLKNFEQRWEKAIEYSELGRLCKRSLHHHNDALYDIEHNSSVASPSTTVPNDHPSLWVCKENDPENWHIQIFRSVDSTSLAGFPNDVVAAIEQNLVYEDNLVMDRSLQMAYIQAIRSAHHFIYIENQYFIGSSFAWPEYRDAGADNLIPMELALKIASKIKAKERFSVYVVIPMWPEGKPHSPARQEILNWQAQTMEMMYQIVAQELKSAGVENAHPTDYLNFYCLGKREERRHKEESSSRKKDSPSEKFGRFMIYVHSKGMVVDDEYVIIGSANINERSMAGSRDTEIAMGAYQPHYTCSKKKEHPFGQVYGYRMSLWAEHIGSIAGCLKDPENLDCVKYVNSVAEDNWSRYTADEFSPLQGHLLKYPLEIHADGTVHPLPQHEFFPDTKGWVRGVRTYLLPTALTT